MKRAFGHRLRRAFHRDGSRPDPDPARPAPEGALREALLRRRERERRGILEVELPDGETIENELGTCYLRTLRYPLGHLHGDAQLGAVFDIDRARLAVLAKEPLVEQLDLRECLFLDTETTGLSGGAGTIVFMTGLGYFKADEFVLEQTFLRSFAEEPAALFHVKQRLVQYPQLVTFVGKSFDRHRLAARMAVHRLRSRVLSSKHLDLYYLARRAYQQEVPSLLPNVRLQTLERKKLGVHRPDDLPGSEAPVAFLDWVRDRTGPVDRVFEHNRLDVLTLVTLLGTLG